MNSNQDASQRSSSSRLENLTTRILFLTAILVVLTAVLAYPVIRGLITGVSVPLSEILSIILVVLLLVGFVLTFVVFRVPQPRRAAPGGSAGIPQVLVRDWLDMQIRIQQVYSPQSSHVSSFAAVSLQVRNSILPQSRQNIGPSERLAAEAANASMLALNNYLSLHASIAWSRLLLERYAAMDRTLFWAAKEVLENVVVGGATFADYWIGLVRQAGAESLGKDLKDTWNRFREPANRLGEDVTGLVRRTGDMLGEGTSIHVTNIREL